MRLTTQQQHLIQHLVHQHLGKHACVTLFGSRLNDHQRGGDVDLVIDTRRHIPLLKRATLKQELEESLNLPVDLVFHDSRHPCTPFQALAKAQGQPMNGTER